MINNHLFNEKAIGQSIFKLTLDIRSSAPVNVAKTLMQLEMNIYNTGLISTTRTNRISITRTNRY